jgi:23S rRNA pseudouridine955/2504/2580 synthase
MSGVKTLTVTADEDGLRLDRWFKSHYPGLTHGRLEKLLRTGQVRVDGGRVKASARLAEGQTVRVPPLGEDGAKTMPPRPAVRPEDVAFLGALVLYRDADVIVLNKPAGLAVQGGSKTTRHLDGMLDALRFDAPERPRLVHRLDRDTSGVLLLARSRKAAAALGRAFRAREARKIYWGLTKGVPRPHRGTVNLALAKQAAVQGRERVTPAHEEDDEARHAITHYAVLAQAAQKAAWLALMPVTGRTHQIRAHCAAIGTPLMGDVKYGGAEASPGGDIAEGLHLHARSLSLRLPSGRTASFTAPLPEHMRRSWEALGFNEEHVEEDPFAEAGL